LAGPYIVLENVRGSNKRILAQKWGKKKKKRRIKSSVVFAETAVLNRASELR
jgi:hypothetical protein